MRRDGTLPFSPMNGHGIPARIADLIGRAKRTGFYTYTDFLEEPALTDALRAAKAADVSAVTYGGASYSTRRMVRFGEDGSYGDAEFPLRVLAILPKGEKFAEEMTHRDYLGALLALGIERTSVGDLLIDGKCAWVAVEAPLADFVLRSLDRVGRTAVICRMCEAFPEALAPKTEEIRLTIPSLRLDAVLSRLWHLSREDSQLLFARGLVTCFGRTVEKCTYTPKEGDVIAVKGYGKVTIRSFPGETKRGRIVVIADKFV